MTTTHSFAYGDDVVTVELDDKCYRQVIRGEPLPTEYSEDEVICEALKNPIASSDLSELVQEGESVCIVIGDMTRSWVRHHVIIPHVIEELQRGGVEMEDIVVVCATGDHRAHTPEEHAALVGEDLASRLRIVDHNARCKDDLVYMGHTTNETPVWVNSEVASADRVVLIGGIVFHFLAGFGGGGKAILPGVSGYDTIMANHSLALSKRQGGGINTEVSAGKTDGNPCYEDIAAGASMVGPTFLVNVIVDDDRHRICMAVAGDMLSAHRVGCRLVENHYSCPIEGREKLVIASPGGYPKDINLYQTYKTLYNARAAVTSGGTMVIISQCREGMGNSDFESMLVDYENNKEREQALREAFTIGGYMGFHTAVMARECDILLLSSMDHRLVSRCGLVPVGNIEEAMAFIRDKHGEIPAAHLMPFGSVLPVE